MSGDRLASGSGDDHAYDSCSGDRGTWMCKSNGFISCVSGPHEYRIFSRSGYFPEEDDEEVGAISPYWRGYGSHSRSGSKMAFDSRSGGRGAFESTSGGGTSWSQVYFASGSGGRNFSVSGDRYYCDSDEEGDD